MGGRGGETVGTKHYATLTNKPERGNRGEIWRGRRRKNQQQKLSAQATIAVRRQPGEKPCAHRNAKQANHRRLNPKTPNAQHARIQLCPDGTHNPPATPAAAQTGTVHQTNPHTGMILAYWAIGSNVKLTPHHAPTNAYPAYKPLPRLLGRLDIDNPTGSNAH